MPRARCFHFFCLLLLFSAPRRTDGTTHTIRCERVAFVSRLTFTTDSAQRTLYVCALCVYGLSISIHVAYGRMNCCACSCFGCLSFSSFDLLLCYTHEAHAQTNRLEWTAFAAILRQRQSTSRAGRAGPCSAISAIWCAVVSGLWSHWGYSPDDRIRSGFAAPNTLISLYIILQVVQCSFWCCERLWP